MIIITRPGITESELETIRERIESLGLRTHISTGAHRTVIGCIGDEALLQTVALRSLPGVEEVTPVMKPYKLSAREFVAEPTVVRVGDEPGMRFGGAALGMISGPCSVEIRVSVYVSPPGGRQPSGTLMLGWPLFTSTPHHP